METQYSNDQITPIRPVIRRTYGKTTYNASGSINHRSEILFDSSPPSSPLLTPHPSSSDILDSFVVSSTLQDSVNIDKENILPRSDAAIIGGKPKQSSLLGFFTSQNNRKRPLSSLSSNVASSSVSKVSRHETQTAKWKSKSSSKSALTQMHLTHLPLLHTCPQCQMSFVRGGEDESTHEKHHSRVVRGIVWEGLGRPQSSNKGKGKARDLDVADRGWTVVRDGVHLANGKIKGRVIMVDASWGGNKLADILYTVDTVLSSPSLPSVILNQCKVFCFLTSSIAPFRSGVKRTKSMSSTERLSKERVIGVVVAQGIKFAMRVLREGEKQEQGDLVDSGDGVFCHLEPLPTPLGIHRLFTNPTFRSLGIAQILLDAACEHTIYGCHFDPTKGEVAFSQPTSSGRAVMEKWGKGGVRVFVDDERQI